jgi:hypothetical protein
MKIAKNNIPLIIFMVSMFAIGGVLGIGFLNLQSRLVTGFGSEGTYPDYSLNERIALSDEIFEGEVISISPAQFNQDSGDYWEATDNSSLVYPYHLIEIKVSQVLKDNIGIGDIVVITQVGNSPTGSKPGIRVEVLGKPEHSLLVGNERIFFIRQMDFPWRDQNLISAFHFVGWAEQSYLRNGDDGRYHAWNDAESFTFEELLSRIQENQANNVEIDMEK